jgi:hypothetical protein
VNGPVEFELRDRRFTASPMPPIEQFHVMRRFSKVSAAMSRLNEGRRYPVPDLAPGEEPDDAKLQALTLAAAETSNILMEAFGELAEDDANYILSHCLARVRMQNGAMGTWAAIWSAGGLMFPDELNYAMVLELVLRVITENLGPFTSVPPAPSADAKSRAA